MRPERGYAQVSQVQTRRVAPHHPRTTPRRLAASAWLAHSCCVDVDVSVPEGTFRHDALLYDGDEAFLAGALPFIYAGLEAEDPVVVAVDRAKIGLLKSELGGDAGDVQFANIREIGSNPARLIPVWKQFIDARAGEGRRFRGIGEPVWHGRTEAELVECHRHESLVNLAFAGVPALSLMCPYDTGSLGVDVIADMHCSHPTVFEAGERRESAGFCGLDALEVPFADPLPGPRAPVWELAFDASELAGIRRFVERRAHSAGLAGERAEDTVLAVNELVTNSIRHAGGRGVLRAWQEPGVLLCEVSDSGSIQDPLAGRRRPENAQVGGYGLWLVNQVCDLVQLRSSANGTTVRVHMRTR
jgi:anti-sigma regulatory factor (Ser/Thr protein kinase)